MSLIKTPLNVGSTGTAVGDLHGQLLALGAAIPAVERNGTLFGEGTRDTVRAFRERYGLPPGDTVDLSTARLLYVASAYADSRTALRAALREVATTDGAPPQEIYWLARHAILALDYRTADRLAKRAPTYDPIDWLEVIVGIPTPQPRLPEVPYPENFYTYQRPWIDPSIVEHVTADWANLTTDQYNPLQRDGGPPALAALRLWQEGNAHLSRRRYAAAIAAYDACQDSVLAYFDAFYPDIQLPAGSTRDRLGALIRSLHQLHDRRTSFWNFFQWRRQLLSLGELEEHDRIVPADAWQSALDFVWRQLGNPSVATDPTKDFRERNLDAPLVTLAFVLVPLARAEANRARRQYEAAIADLRWVLDSVVVGRTGNPPEEPIRFVRARLACEFIELPFAALLLAETMLDKADAEYKARVPADPPPAPKATAFQNLRAAQTYLAIKDLFTDEGQYVARVEAGRSVLARQIQERLAANDTRSREFQLLGKSMSVPTIVPTSAALPGLDRRTKAHEPLVKFTPPSGQTVMRETNPRIYAALLTATAGLEQLQAGCNYLGYRDDYVPPWKFPFLLDRARYFAEHAKNAQREYLNFLTNAEREEFQELSAAQNLELEKSNVRIETARVDQVLLEVAAAKQSADLATLVADNSRDRLQTYAAFDEYADDLMDTDGAKLMVAMTDELPGVVNSVLENLPYIGGFFSTPRRKLVEAAQREVEKHNLELAAAEAAQSANVAAAQLAAAQAGLMVASLQRQAALLRHAFAVENLNFLRNRTVTAELWYRLAGAVRSVSETYLRYAMEMAFLAEQAYEFEADKRINVIRFDYDLSEVGDMLAGDFLLRDLDTLEQDLIVGQRMRQQQVRYILSMAREFPDALQELRETGAMTFSLRLEQLERRLPGLFNLRIASVEVLPVALMDPTRFSLELTHLGIGQVRLRTQPDTTQNTASTSPLNTADMDDWLGGLEEQWPVKIRVTGPDTAVFTGLSRQDLAGLSSSVASNQRGAFEGVSGAGAWKLDLSMQENRIRPDTLADVLVTFTLSAYHDSELRDAVARAPRRPSATTTWFSAHQDFPDAFYELNRAGRMVWHVTPDDFALQGAIGELRNLAVLCSRSRRAPELGRVICSYPVEFEVDEAGTIRLLRALPLLSFSTSALALNVSVQPALAPAVTFDFGDGTGLGDSTALPHTYARAGRYDVRVRIVADGRLTEYGAAVVVSRQHAVQPPCVVVPRLQASVEAGKIKLQPSIRPVPGESLSVSWRIDDRKADPAGDPVAFTLEPGRHILYLSAVRRLTARFYSQQRYAPSVEFPMNGLRVTSNRTFDAATGAETTTSLNAFGQHVFGSGILSPNDRWTLELPMEVNPCAVSVTSTDVKQYDLSELSDAVLALEYNVQAG